MKERSYASSILIVSFFMTFLVSACGGNMDDKKDTSHWTEDFNLWYEWKIKDINLTQEQKTVIADIEKINDMTHK